MPEPTILERIVARRREDVAALKAARPLAVLERAAAEAGPTVDLVARVLSAPGVAVMAEVKRASPSRGDIAPHADAAALARRYAEGGAVAVSVLTEPHWFKGCIEDLERARAALDAFDGERPALLRKDFLIDPYQVVEARAAGADAVLLIVACLDDHRLRELLSLAHALGMQALVEVNSAAELERAVAAGAGLIGINNRNLHDFSVDRGTVERVAALCPTGTVLAALSGVEGPEDVERFARAGAKAVLVGEALMRAPDPAALIRSFAGIPTARQPWSA